MGWRVRRAVSDEWWLVREVRLESLQDAPEAFGSTYQRDASFGEGRWRDRVIDSAWFLAESEPGPDTAPESLGLVAGIRPESPPEERHLVAMWVAPSARGSGVAVDLVQAVVEWSRADGASRLTLGVAEGNERARAFYLKCGFLPTDLRFPLESDATRSIEIYALSV
jgi:GNAT superfamily N-acetyltransferase